MRKRFLFFALVSTAAALPLGLLAGGPAFAVKKAPYPQIKVDLAEKFQPDEAFRAMREAFAGAVAKKDAQALFALVGSSFVWTSNGTLNAEFNPAAGPLDNFKVVFGFRTPGTATDGGVENGPFWDDLAAFAADNAFYKDANMSGLVCGPMLAEVSDEDAFEEAGKKVDSAEEPTIWYFTLTETTVTASRDPKATAVGKVGTVALPLVSVFPPQEGAAPRPPTHLEVLLPSGKSGWLPVSAARPIVSNRLCYAKNAAGNWSIVLFDEVGEADE
jgi:hypothetical protein